MIGVSGLFMIYNVVTHSHDHPREGLSYMKFNNKPYPWSCPTCNLFDNECWAKCKGKDTGAAAAHH